MKTTLIAILGIVLPFASFSQSNSDSTGLPGDQLDLHGVLELFKNSENMEAFEKALNTESNQVNNLDLNSDNNIDYIRVVDKSDSTSHAIILQVPINDNESQDVAVIEIEKTGNDKAQLQIVGDEDLYGKEYYVEPVENSDNKMPEFGKTPAIIVNVWFWPSVRFIYAPVYRPWVSPWRWRVYPKWWSPWRPVAWHVYHPRVVRYHAHYHRVHVHRCAHAHRVYHPHRTRSAVVHGRAKAHPHQGRKAQPANRKQAQPKKAAPRKTQAKKAAPRKK